MNDTTLLPAQNDNRGMIETQISRQAQEVQAAMVVAKKFPRDEVRAFNRILQSCQRKGLAEEAIYSYPRGGTTVEGPSIRLAEEMARQWGNVDFGIIELEQDTIKGESSVMAYAWDLETNTRQTKIFTVPHFRRASGQNKRLEDPRDIYEMVANQGARRLRACVLGIIPKDIQDEAVTQCNKTMESGHKDPLIDRLRKMVVSFADFGVSQEMLEKRLQHKIDASSEPEFVNLKKIWVSMRDGASKREDWFDVTAGSTAKPTKPDFDRDEKEQADAGLAPVKEKKKKVDPNLPDPTDPAATTEPDKKEQSDATPPVTELDPDAVDKMELLTRKMSDAHVTEAQLLDWGVANKHWGKDAGTLLLVQRNYGSKINFLINAFSKIAAQIRKQ